MKPAGRERDKQIAELKGLCWHEWITEVTMLSFGYEICKNCGKERRKIGQNLSWSTLWNDAKELWDELPKKQQVNLLISMAIRLTNDNKFDFPDRVSQAWIEWRGGGV